MWLGDTHEDSPPQLSPALHALLMSACLGLARIWASVPALVCEGAEQASTQLDGATSCVSLRFSLSPSWLVLGFYCTSNAQFTFSSL